MGDDKWIHREPGSVSGSFVPPPVDPDEKSTSSPPLPRRKPFNRSAGSEQFPPGSARRASGSDGSAPSDAGSPRPVTGSGLRRLHVTRPQVAPPELPDNVRYLFKPVLTQAAPEIKTARSTDKGAAAEQERGSGRSALARDPGTGPLPVTAAPASGPSATAPSATAPPASGPPVTPPTVTAPPASGPPVTPPTVTAPLVTAEPAPMRPEAGSHRRRPVGLGDSQPVAAGSRSWVRSRVRRHGIRVAVVFLVVVAAVSTVFALARHDSTAGKAGPASAGHRPQTSRKVGGQSNGGNAVAGLSAAGIVRAQAARWVSTQVSKNDIIACDDVMCSELINEGVSASNLLVLSPTAPDPLGADIVMGTAALRSQFGSRLATEYAPSVIASFGSGRSRVDVRVVAPDGAADYEKAQASGIAARQRDGSLLLHNSKITVSASARPELIAGLVDPRLLVMLPVLAGQHPIQVIGFYDRAPRPSPGIPLTGAEIAGADAASGLSGSRYLRWLLTFMHGQRAQFRPVSVTTARIDGHPVVRVRFARPSPIGLP
jgi:hypothetical protein